TLARETGVHSPLVPDPAEPGRGDVQHEVRGGHLDDGEPRRVRWGLAPGRDRDAEAVSVAREPQERGDDVPAVAVAREAIPGEEGHVAVAWERAARGAGFERGDDRSDHAGRGDVEPRRRAAVGREAERSRDREERGRDANAPRLRAWRAGR